MAKWKGWAAIVFLLAGIGIRAMSVEAGTIFNSPYVTFSPDGKAWTTNAGDQNVEWYEEGGADDVETGIPSALQPLRAGEHYYDFDRRGTVPVGRWVVKQGRVNCCHNGYLKDDEYHGVPISKQTCLKPHFSGWFAYCADCGRLIVYGHIYMSRNAARSIDYLEMGKGFSYYYLCPFNRNLEQGMDMDPHVCKAVSANRYRVEYLANADGDTYGGHMMPSYHMYGNTARYEGEAVTPQTHLNKNGYHRIGWRFAGWNTQADGGGTFYGDEAEILNLCAGDYLRDADGGTVKLYAMWERNTGTLEIDPAGGSYLGNPGITVITGGYGSTYELKPEAVTSPAGFTVSFETGGGTPLQDITGTGHFVEWMQNPGFCGKLRGNTYSFLAADKTADRVTAVYAYDPVRLPAAHKENASFGGWYYDAGFTMPAGDAGTLIVPERDTVLYAQWVELRLSAFDNYSAREGRGAVDLSWSQADGRDKVYKIYQSAEGGSFRPVNTADDFSINLTAERTYEYSGREERYIVPYSGLYDLAAWGAQGGNYDSFSGGQGGEVTGRFWLDRGEILRITVGGQNGYNGGGTGDRYACGGGCTTVYSDSRGLLIAAGGGGGAAPNGNGYAGGSSQSLVPVGMAGESGASGGGGGHRGGKAGELILHYHADGICNHKHIGDPAEYGGCYTRPVVCGMELEHEYTGSEIWYWGGGDEEYCPNCGADASLGESCTGHETEYYDHNCPIHGEQEANTSSSEPTRCTVVTSYAADCGWTEEYFCGYPYDGCVISSKSAYGGSNYVREAAASSYLLRSGIRQGNGCFTMVSADIGYQETLRLDGVDAPDREPPEEIELSGVSKTAVSQDRILVSWKRPSDRGTRYYHKAESYLKGSAGMLCTSNITVNTLTSGIKGYYYCIDDRTDTQLDAEQGIFTEDERVLAALSETEGYLHVRVADVAGNLSRTTHIPLGSRVLGDTDVAWPLCTKQLVLEEGAHVHAAPQQDTFYVRADGRTPFSIQYEACMQGPAAAGYQLKYAVFENAEPGGQWARNIIGLPNHEIDDSEIRLEARDLSFSAEGASLLQNDGYTLAVRTARGRELSVTQRFVPGAEDDGRIIEIIPRAGADFKGEKVWSDRNLDAANGLRIVGDGRPPVIDGTGQLENLALIDRRDGAVELLLSASDELSGLRELRLKIRNLDNDAMWEWEGDASGTIRLSITENEPIFSGDFTITVYAADNVGNETTLTYGATEFDLQAEVERMLSPHAPIFKRGESGILRITTWGYAERVEIEFPPELAEWDEILNRTYVYEMKQHYRQEEEYEFMIPLYAPENAQYTITVRAYKGDKKLERYPTVSLIGVEGTVLDELRTRLRLEGK